MNYIVQCTGEILAQRKEECDNVYEGKIIRMISGEEVDRLIEIKIPDGLFYRQLDIYLFLGIHATNGDVFVEEFNSKCDCFDWLVGKEKKDEVTD